MEQRKALAIEPNSDTLHYALAQRSAEAWLPLMASTLAREPDIVGSIAHLAREAAVDPVFAKMRELGEFKRLVVLADTTSTGGPQ